MTLALISPFPNSLIKAKSRFVKNGMANFGGNIPTEKGPLHDHMVRNKLHSYTQSYAVGLPKQRNSHQSIPTFLCFGSPSYWLSERAGKIVLSCLLFVSSTLVPEVFLDFSPLEMREPRSDEHISSGQKNQEKPLGPGYVSSAAVIKVVTGRSVT